MGKTLADVLKKRQEAAERADRPKIDYFSLANNNPARIRFLQELDPDAPNYDKDKGSALFLVEHTSPQQFTRKAICTMETEGRCFACEMNQEQPKERWWSRINMYVQVFDAKDEKVKVLSRSAPGPFFDQLVDWANEENEEHPGSVVGPTFKISKGPNKTDSWVVTKTNRVLELPDVVELVDLTQAVGANVEYDKQRNFYLPKGDSEPEPEDESIDNDPKMDW